MNSDATAVPQIIIVGDSRALPDISFEIYASSDASSLGSNIASVIHTTAEPISTISNLHV